MININYSLLYTINATLLNIYCYFFLFGGVLSFHPGT